MSDLVIMSYKGIQIEPAYLALARQQKADIRAQNEHNMEFGEKLAKAGFGPNGKCLHSLKKRKKFLGIF